MTYSIRKCRSKLKHLGMNINPDETMCRFCCPVINCTGSTESLGPRKQAVPGLKNLKTVIF